MTLGAFACVLAMRRPEGMVEDIDELSGLAADQPGHGDRAGDAAVLAGRHSAARRLLRQVLRVRGGGEGRAVAAGRVRRAGQRGRRLLLRAHRQDHVLRRAEGAVPRRAGQGRPWSWGWRACSCCSTSSGRRRWSSAADAARQDACSEDSRAAEHDRSACAAHRCAASILDEVGSTNTEAFERAAAGEAGPLWIWRGARRRAAAGRAGTGPRSPAISTPACCSGSPARRPSVHQLSLLAGVAVVEAIGGRGGAALSPACASSGPTTC